jgi:hypothetical protein
VLRKDFEPADAVFYGPNLPLDQGSYSVEMVFGSEAPPGTCVGQLGMRDAGGKELENRKPVTVGAPAVLKWEQTDNKPFCIVFRFSRAAEVRLDRVRLVRER